MSHSLFSLRRYKPLGRAHKIRKLSEKIPVSSTLNAVQKRLVWLSAFCYLVLQGIVPAGYMPSFGLSSSSSPFVLCHGDDASAQWLDIQQNLSSGHASVQQTSADLLGASELGNRLSQNMVHEGDSSISHSAPNFSSESNNHSVNFDCGFSSFYFTQVLASFTSLDFAPNEVVFKSILRSQSFVVNSSFTQLQARAPPLSNSSFIATA